MNTEYTPGTYRYTSSTYFVPYFFFIILCTRNALLVRPAQREATDRQTESQSDGIYSSQFRYVVSYYHMINLN